MFKRALLVLVFVVVTLFASAGVASARPVVDPAPTTCALDQEFVGGHCETPHQVDMTGGQADVVATGGIVLLGVLALAGYWSLAKS